MGKGVREQLPSALAGRIRRYRRDRWFVLVKWSGCRIPVYGRGRPEDDPCNPPASRRIEQSRRRGDVSFHIGAGVLERRPHTRFRGEMDDGLHPVERQRIARDIRLDKLKTRVLADPLEVPLLHRACVERVEIIDACNPVASREERVGEMRADEPRGAGEEHLCTHRAAVVSGATTLRKYSMVRFSPSSSGTFGSQLSVARA